MSCWLISSPILYRLRTCSRISASDFDCPSSGWWISSFRVSQSDLASQINQHVSLMLHSFYIQMILSTRAILFVVCCLKCAPVSSRNPHIAKFHPISSWSREHSLPHWLGASQFFRHKVIVQPSCDTLNQGSFDVVICLYLLEILFESGNKEFHPTVVALALEQVINRLVFTASMTFTPTSVLEWHIQLCITAESQT